jgi:hypothetical protein
MYQTSYTVPVMWKNVPTSIVTASPEARVMWTSAAKGVAHATAAHEVRAVETRTPRHVGFLLTKATTAQFGELGVQVHQDSIEDVSGDMRMFRSLADEPAPGDRFTEMAYDMTITDSNATVYTARLYLNDAMLGLCAGDSSYPLVFHAMAQLDSIHESMPDVAETLQRAFGTNSGTSSTHCVATAVTSNRRMFPIGSNMGATKTTPNMVGTQTDKTVLFNSEREVTHHLTTHSVRAVNPSNVKGTGSHRYLVAQNVKIEETGGVYSANVMISIAGSDTQGVAQRTDAVTYKMHPYVALEDDVGINTRTSTMHVFTKGNHYSMLVTHMHDASASRSLQLSAYASLNALRGYCVDSDIDQIMRSASMETLFDSNEIPLIVARGSPDFLCVVVSGVRGSADGSKNVDGCEDGCEDGCGDGCEDGCHCVQGKVSAACITREAGQAYLVEMDKCEASQLDKCEASPLDNYANTLDIDSLPVPVQNALRRQWN